jgi:hypothetical protein
MDGQVNKKREIIIGDKTIKVQSKRITVENIKMGKVKIGNVWYIFDLQTGKVMSQGNNWTDCLNMIKVFINEHIKGKM